jgi:hypothetical protein
MPIHFTIHLPTLTISGVYDDTILKGHFTAAGGQAGFVEIINASILNLINSLMPELNPSMQRCLTRLFTGDFAS